MSPREVRAIQRHRRTITVTCSLAGLVALGLATVILGLGTIHPDYRQHVWGQSTEVEATVVDSERNGKCRSAPEWRVEVEWTHEGKPGSGHVKQCRERPRDGDRVTVWFTDDATYDDSPTMLRVLMPLGIVVFGVLGSIALLAVRRCRRAAREVLSGAPPSLEWDAIGAAGQTGFARVTEHGPVPIRGLRLSPFLAIPARAIVPGPPRGKLVATDLRRGKPRGIVLYATTDGARTWWFRI